MNNKQPIEIIAKFWGNDIATMIESVAENEHVDMNIDQFLEHCTACGGNWGGMLLTGIKELFPMVWDAIPDNMGRHAFVCICSVLEICGVNQNQEG